MDNPSVISRFMEQSVIGVISGDIPESIKSRVLSISLNVLTRPVIPSTTESVGTLIHILV